MTPEKAAEVLKRAEALLRKNAQQAALYHELIHSTVAEVGQKCILNMPRWSASKKDGAPTHCARCMASFNDGWTHKVFEFNGRYWHQHNCLGAIP